MITEAQVRQALAEHPTIVGAAAALGISRHALNRLMAKYGIKITRGVA